MAPFKKRENINVVVADDDATTRAALRLLLQDHFYTVVGEAADGERAVELCMALKPHVVFLDIDMPKLNGNQAAQRLRELHPEIGIVVVSALSTLDNVQQARQSGASAFVVKPFNAAKLIGAIDSCLKGNHPRQ
ncbi:response regulator transcription factor [Noviherbaspirillum sedimenti]|uniref:response regulator transcription factor n=1 Tax=Noviherbaspirillum sedimenti TaxID=2320865 RepID=UPI00131497FF|nr:response regulator transcription factor [Noviherbaspirillum sedimenti]